MNLNNENFHIHQNKFKLKKVLFFYVVVKSAAFGLADPDRADSFPVLDWIRIMGIPSIFWQNCNFGCIVWILKILFWTSCYGMIRIFKTKKAVDLDLSSQRRIRKMIQIWTNPNEVLMNEKNNDDKKNLFIKL